MSTGSATNDTGTAARTGRADEIRDAAARIFHEKGYDATSIQDIADAVGILKGSLYYYIDTKEDLLFDVIKEAHEQGLRAVREWADTDLGPADKLRQAIEIHVSSNLRHLEGVGVFFHDFRSLGPERRQEIVRDRDFYDHRLREVVKEGQDQGVFNPDLDPKLAVMAMLGMMNWVYQWYRPGGRLGPMQVAREFADLVLGGLARRDEDDVVRLGPPGEDDDAG